MKKNNLLPSNQGIVLSQVGGVVQGLAIAIAIILFAFLVGCIAIANDDESLGKVQLISHEGRAVTLDHYERSSEQGRCYDSECSNQDYDQDYGNRGDQSRCRGNNCRGSFSPGPFDRSPVDIHDNQVCISPDCSSHNDNARNTDGRQPEPA